MSDTPIEVPRFWAATEARMRIFARAGRLLDRPDMWVSAPLADLGGKSPTQVARMGRTGYARLTDLLGRIEHGIPP